MRGASAAQRREREPSAPPDAAAVIARLEQVSAETAGLLGALRRQDSEITAAAAKIASLPADCAGAVRLAAAARRIEGRQERQARETIGCEAKLDEFRELLERLAPMIPSRATAYAAGREDGLREAADLAAAERPPKARHARRRHLSPVPGIPSTAVRAAAAGIVAAGLTGGLVAGMHEESSVRYAASSPARLPVLHRMAPDRAAVIPQPRSSPSQRPSAAAAGASPVPSSPPPPSPVPSPPAPSSPPAPVPVPALSVPRLLDLGDSILGQLSLSVTAGVQSVQWTATATDGIRLSSYSGTAVQGEPVVLGVSDGPGRGGLIYVSFGPSVIPVHVSCGLGVAVLALP